MGPAAIADKVGWAASPGSAVANRSYNFVNAAPSRSARAVNRAASADDVRYFELFPLNGRWVSGSEGISMPRCTAREGPATVSMAGQGKSEFSGPGLLVRA